MGGKCSEQAIFLRALIDCEKKGVLATRSNIPWANRAQDRARQSLKRAGAVRWDSGQGWSITTLGKSLAANWGLLPEPPHVK